MKMTKAQQRAHGKLLAKMGAKTATFAMWRRVVKIARIDPGVEAWVVGVRKHLAARRKAREDAAAKPMHVEFTSPGPSASAWVMR